MDIFGPNELNICITSCENLFTQLNTLLDYLQNKSVSNIDISNKVIEIISELIIIFKNFGTESFSDLVTIILDTN